MGKFVSAGLILLAVLLGWRVASSTFFARNFGNFALQPNATNQIAAAPQTRTTGFSRQTSQQTAQRLDAQRGQKPLPPNQKQTQIQKQNQTQRQNQTNQPISGRW